MEVAALLAIHSRPRRCGRALAGKARVAAGARCPALRSEGPAHPHFLQFIRLGIRFHDVDLDTYHAADSHDAIAYGVPVSIENPRSSPQWTDLEAA